MGYDYDSSYGKPVEEEDKKKDKMQKKEIGGQATAEGYIQLSEAGYQAFISGAHGGPGDAWTVARLAGIMGAKQADELVLVSNSFNLIGIEMEYETDEKLKSVTVRCEVRTLERVGSETAALIGCGLSLMSLVDSLRAIDRNTAVSGLRIKRD